MQRGTDVFNLRIHLCLLSSDTTTRIALLTYDTICLRFRLNNNDSGEALAPDNVAYEDDFNKMNRRLRNVDGDMPARN